MFFTTDDRTLSDTTIRGFAPSSAAINTSFKTSEIWTRSFPSSETVLSVELVGYDAVASFGRVLGDKSTLYKYLNPHLSLVTTTSPAAGTAHIYVIDTITGGTVYAVDLLDVAAEEKVQSAMVENWLVYAWRDTNGRRIASVELYEDRTGGKIETLVSSNPDGFSKHGIDQDCQPFQINTASEPSRRHLSFLPRSRQWE